MFHPDDDMRGKHLIDTREGQEGRRWPWTKALSEMSYMVLEEEKVPEEVAVVETVEASVDTVVETEPEEDFSVKTYQSYTNLRKTNDSKRTHNTVKK